MATDQPCPSSPRVRSKGTATSSKNTSQNSWAPCMVSIGRTVMPGLSMSTNRAVMPLWAESGVPVRVSSTHRSAYWARLVHTFCPVTRQPSSCRVARQVSEARLLPVPGSENPWHQVSSPRSSRGTIAAASSGRRSRSSSGPAPRSWSRCRARPGPAWSVPHRGRPVAAATRRVRRLVRAIPSASIRRRRRAASPW